MSHHIEGYLFEAGPAGVNPFEGPEERLVNAMTKGWPERMERPVWKHRVVEWMESEGPPAVLSRKDAEQMLAVFSALTNCPFDEPFGECVIDRSIKSLKAALE